MLQVVNPKTWMIAITAGPDDANPVAFGALLALASVIPEACLAGSAAAGAGPERLPGAHRR